MNTTFYLIAIVQIGIMSLVAFKLYGLLEKVPQLASNRKRLWAVLLTIDFIVGIIMLQIVASLLFWIQWLVLALILVGGYYAWRWLRGKTGGKGGRG